jgi:hypothetical protein
MDIYNKIVKMYKNFKLTDEERKQILEMHESHGYKKPVNEQIVSVEQGSEIDLIISTKDKEFVNYINKINKMKQGRDNLYFGSFNMYFDGKTKKFMTMGQDSGFLKKEKPDVERWSDQILSAANELVQFIKDDESKQKFRDLQQKNPFFYAYLIDKYKQNENYHRKIKNKNIIIDDVVSVKQVPPPTQVQPKETIEPGVQIATDRNVVKPNLFQNNEATLRGEFVTYINESVMSVVNELKQNLADKGGTGTGVLDSMTIYASSSRTRNGESKTVQNDGKNCAINPTTKQPFAACPTHLTLSKGRAEAAKRYMIDLLKKNKIEVDESKIQINFQGQNGDGTSGPEFNPQTDKASDEKFQIHQRVDVDCIIAIRTTPDVKTKTTPPDEKATEPTTETDYKVRITGKEKNKLVIDINLTFDFLKFRLPGFRSNKGSRADLRQVRCTAPR